MSAQARLRRDRAASGRLGKTILLAISVQAALLLGCAELDTLLGKPKTNQPVASASPAATSSPSGLDKFTRSLDNVGKDITAPIDAMRKSVNDAIDNISDADERAIGQATALEIIQNQGGLVLDKELVTYVNEVANLVAQQGKRQVVSSKGQPRIKARRFFVGVLNNSSYNAFALPGGYILLTRGLLENLGGEAELAWVLGHEIAHVDNEDGLKALKAQVRVKAGAQELGLTGQQGEKPSFENSKFFSKMVGTLADFSLRVGMGKQDELDADLLGLQYATKAGYDAGGAERVLGLLGTIPSERKLLKSHDTAETRVGLLKEKIEASRSKRFGLARYDVRCIQRLEAMAVVAAAPAASPTPEVSGGGGGSANDGSEPAP